MENRLATKADLDNIMQLVAQAKLFMKGIGLDQWQDGYPFPVDFEEDIERGECHVFVENGEIAATITVSGIPEQAYGEVYDGAWLTGDIPYAIIHRSTVSDKFRGRGLGFELLSFGSEIAKKMGFKTIRVDTHADNAPMRATLEKCGYKHCGKVYLFGIEQPRLARVIYEKPLN